jgi:hypothetical protein
VAQPRNRPPTSSCCSCHHAARTRPRWPPGPSNKAYLSSPHLEASPATTFRACSSAAPTRVMPQPAPAILSQESVHTTLSITHHTRKRPSTCPRTTHGPHIFARQALPRSVFVGGIRNQAFRIPKIKECFQFPEVLCERLSGETPGVLESTFISQNPSFAQYPSSPADPPNKLRITQGVRVSVRLFGFPHDETPEMNLTHQLVLAWDSLGGFRRL